MSRAGPQALVGINPGMGQHGQQAFRAVPIDQASLAKALMAMAMGRSSSTAGLAKNVRRRFSNKGPPTNKVTG
jgi:hypothetical protein